MKTVRSLEDTCIKPKPDFERLKKSLFRKGNPDDVPFYELYANKGTMEKVLMREIKTASDIVEFYYKTGYDYVPVGIYLPLTKGSLVDSSKGYPVTDRESFEKYSWPSIQDINYNLLEETCKALPEGMKIIGQTNGIFENAESLCGYEGLCYLLLDDRKLVEEIFRRLEELFTALYTAMASFKEVGALVISDDMGFKTQTLIAPGDLREFVLPRHKKFTKIAHQKEKPCILHSCGNLKTIMDDIINDVGIDAKHSFEDAILPITEAGKLYGRRIALLGGFDVDRLCRSTEDEIRKHTRLLIEECGSDGGYALGSGNSIADYIPIENYLCMLDQGWSMRK